ncbi:MAG TPA: nucleotidyl transferase AbiEii/AbiGii toxin family protein [Solirubrobacteraceae bacterium]|nr:nucleotidyl transferase AbiEii/AbiGii toxin family protein [Solirubrobacteraceae bacterium]
MIDRNQIIRQANEDGVPAATVERDYILSHVLAAIAACDQAKQIVFKGGTALRLCYFEDYRYSADLDFSLIGELDRPGALQAVAGALAVRQQALGLPALSLTNATPPRIEYTGPLGRSRRLKLDLADDELVENKTRRPVFQRYSDQGECDCLTYTLEETAAEKLRCVIQRLQCRDLYDIHELFVVRGLDSSFVWPLFERNAGAARASA